MFSRLWILVVIVASMSRCVLAVDDRPFFFIQLSDPQFGMCANNADVDQEKANLDFAVATIHRLRPAFVVITGDLINQPGDRAQLEAYRQTVGKIGSEIPVYTAPGNHDVGQPASPVLLDAYREAFGPDHYTFRAGPVFGIVLNSSLLVAPEKAPEAAQSQETWLQTTLADAPHDPATQILIFQHHAWFVKDLGEPDQYFNMPQSLRQRYWPLFQKSGVRAVFAGHLHQNAEAKADNITMVTTGAIGRPLGDSQSGLRVVIVRPDDIEHQFFGLGNIPNQITSRPR